MNTRIIPAEYNYVAPFALSEALNILAKKKNVKVLAGGTDLIVNLKCNEDIQIQTMLDIKHIEELVGIKFTDEGMEIGAATKLSDIEDNAEVTAKYPALHDAIKAMASIAVRHMGTIGGNFGNASPVSDTAGPALVYDAKVKLVSTRGERLVPAREFYLAPGKSACEADELIYSIIFPAVKGAVGTAFCKKSRVKADISKVSTTVYVAKDGDQIADLRVAMGAVAAVPLYLGEICAKYVGKKGDESTFAAIAKECADSLKPITDIRSTADYRKAVAEVILNDSLALAWDRAGGAK